MMLRNRASTTLLCIEFGKNQKRKQFFFLAEYANVVASARNISVDTGS